MVPAGAIATHSSASTSSEGRRVVVLVVAVERSVLVDAFFFALRVADAVSAGAGAGAVATRGVVDWNVTALF